MKPNRIAEPISTGKTVLGLCQMFPAPGIIEVIGTGWDFIWIDGQHGALDLRAISDSVRVTDHLALGSLLRVPTHDSGWLGVYADLDPDAIMIPMVDTPEQARQIVRALRFAPQGARSYGGRRVIDRNGREYYRTRQPVIVAQIETVEALENVDQIASTPGIDALFFGPDDVKVQLGIDVNTSPVEHPRLLDAMARTAKAAKNAGKFAGTVAPSVAAVKLLEGMGYQMIVGGGDVMFLRSGAANRLKEIREAAASAPVADKPRSSVY